MTRPLSPTGHLEPTLAAPTAAAGLAATVDGGEQPIAELRRIVSSMRARLDWIRNGGIDGIPVSDLQHAQPGTTTAETAPTRFFEESRPAGAVHAPPEMLRTRASQEGDRPPVANHPTDAEAAARAALERAKLLAAAPMEPSRSRVRDKPASSKLFAEPTTQNTPGGDYPELASLPHGEEGLRIVRDFIGDCRRCKLCHGRNQLVFGEGSAYPWIAFVGEGPGADEDRTGRPFVGAAGELLSKMIKAMGEHALKMGLPELASRLRREEVYIGNVVKCRPPGNRTPEPDEVSACGGFITAQLACLAPRVIVALGRTPTQFLLQNNAPLGRLRGQFGVFRGVPVMPTYHPAYLLRAPSAKAQVWEDLKLVISRLAECQSETQPMAQL